MVGHQDPPIPKAVQDTNNLLETVIKELVISRTGPRYILGDFNHPAFKLPAIALLKSYGWMNIQELGFDRGIWEHLPTCRGSTTSDFVLISPELIPLYKKTCSWPWFADHLISGAEFELPVQPEMQRAWPQPSAIPWKHVQWEAWKTQSISPPLVSGGHFHRIF